MDKRIMVSNQNKWIVTNKLFNKVFASDKSLDGLQKKIRSLKIKNAIISFVPHVDRTLTPYAAC